MSSGNLLYSPSLKDSGLRSVERRTGEGTISTGAWNTPRLLGDSDMVRKSADTGLLWQLQEHKER